MAELHELVIKLEGDIKDLEKNLDRAVKKLEKTEDSTANVEKAMTRAFAGTVTIAAIYKLGKAVVDAGMAMDALNSRMLAAVSDAKLAGESISFVSRESDRLGLSFVSTANEFASFSAAALRSGMSMEEVQKVFIATSEAVTVMKLSTADSSLVFNALSQMAAKGVISMEELRQQLGERLPFAMAAMADGLGITQQKLIDLVSSGKLAAKDALPALAEGMKKITDPSLAMATDSLQSNMNRLNNEIDRLFAAVAGSGANDVLNWFVKMGSIGAEGLRRLVELDPAVGSLAHQMGMLTKAEKEAALAAEELINANARILENGPTFGNIAPDLAGEYQKSLPGAGDLGIDFDKLEKDLEGLGEYFKTKEELELEHLTARMEMLQEFNDMETALNDEQKQKLIDAEDRYRQAIISLNERMANEKKQVEERHQKVVDRMRDANFSSAISMMKSLFSENKAASVALIALEKAKGIAQVRINTEIAAARALAELGPIAGPPVAASIRMQGMISQALIAAQGLLEAGTALSSGGSSTGGGFSSTSSQAESATSSGAMVTASRSADVQINIQGTMFTDEQVRELVERINDQVSDNVTLRMA